MATICYSSHLTVTSTGNAKGIVANPLLLVALVEQLLHLLWLYQTKGNELPRSETGKRGQLSSYKL